MTVWPAPMEPALSLIEQRARVAVVGVPRSGKTTYARELAQVLGLNCWHTDDLRRPDNAWHKQAEQALLWMQEPAPWLIEGVTALLALELGAPADVVIWLPRPRQHLTRGQGLLARECEHAWDRLSLPNAWVLKGAEEAWTWLGDLQDTDPEPPGTGDAA